MRKIGGGGEIVMEKNKQLDIDSFNEILFGAIPNGKHIGLLEAEIKMAYGMKVQAMEELVDCLNKRLPYHKELESVNAIDSSLDKLEELLEREKAKQ